MTHRLPFPCDDGSTGILEVPYLPLTADDCARVQAIAAALVVDEPE